MNFFLLVSLVSPTLLGDQPKDAPRAVDPRLTVERIAADPEIVHPIGLAFDAKGRLLVIESHTHFAPPNYQGPKFDRVRILEEAEGPGKTAKFSTFFEGTRASMDIACHPDGSIYLATRNEILRLRDTKNQGRADEVKRIVFLETRGDYPHNGLSGLAFDFAGNLYFGMGENLGAGYRLQGSDGTVIADAGEGGNIFRCSAEGKELTRIATGFWNPFGVCFDFLGRMIAVDNDPDAMPPCRMLHVVEGGDYGYQFRYGRTGRHPFQAWDGQIPGTLPQMAGTGEAPCEVLQYEHIGLPEEYRGDLFVTSWADHRVERYSMKSKGASTSAERKPFVQGGADFRPTGLAVGPDGSLYFADWVLRNYTLHGRGAIWRLRWREAPKPGNFPDGLASPVGTVRENYARQLLVQGEAGLARLRQSLHSNDPRVRAAALTALAEDAPETLTAFAAAEKIPELRALAVRALARRGRDLRSFAEDSPPVQMEAIAGIQDVQILRKFWQASDPFLRHGAIRRLAQLPPGWEDQEKTGPGEEISLLLTRRERNGEKDRAKIPGYLQHVDPEVRFLAAKWIADGNLPEFRAPLLEALKDRDLSTRLAYAFATALARIEGRDVNENQLAETFFQRAIDPKNSPAGVLSALQLLPANSKKLTPKVLQGFLDHQDAAVRLEAVRMLQEAPAPDRGALVRTMALRRAEPESLRAEAVAALSPDQPEDRKILLELVGESSKILRQEALRSLTRASLSGEDRKKLESLNLETPAERDLVKRVFQQPIFKDRPAKEDTPGWLKRLEGPGDAEAGRRVFFHPRLAGCARCHRIDGRGAEVGPDLSGIGRTERQHILASLLEPDRLVPPHFQVWAIITSDGQSRTGMLMKTHLDEYTYVDTQGRPFQVKTPDIEETRAVPGSLMPAGLVDSLTDEELRDLLAYLQSRRK